MNWLCHIKLERNGNGQTLREIQNKSLSELSMAFGSRMERKEAFQTFGRLERLSDFLRIVKKVFDSVAILIGF